jgi:hypothetical protein
LLAAAQAVLELLTQLRGLWVVQALAQEEQARRRNLTHQQVEFHTQAHLRRALEILAELVMAVVVAIAHQVAVQP